MSKLTDYPFEVRLLSADEGGGYLISFPDFAECISDGILWMKLSKTAATHSKPQSQH